ncbi:hypothetical protein ACHAWF_007247 [Thalassiosira exigua]
MPSLVLTGHPCTGKTTFARLLAARALRHPSGDVSRVVHIRESTAVPDRSKAACYSDSHAEKIARAALKSEFDRAVMAKSSEGGDDDGGDGSGSTLVILDSLNYIKGYRYELYCISKAAGERHGVVWIMGDKSDGEPVRAGLSSSSDELAKKRNRERKEFQVNQKDCAGSGVELDGYFEDDATMDALVLRFEPPDGRYRWENPLYKVDMAGVFPWGKDGTLKEDHKPKPGNGEEGSSSLTSQMREMELKEQPNAPTKPPKKSAAGFKRRGKKSSKQTPLQQPKSDTSTTPPAHTVPSSISSRNLPTPDRSGTDLEQRSEGKQKIESIVDGILDSFLTDTAPLKQGMSTLQQTSAESNALNQVDNVTQRTNTEILKVQRASSISPGVGGRVFVTISNDGGDGKRHAMNLSKPLYANDLRNCRRQFLKWTAAHPMKDGTTEEEIMEAYLSFIESNI